MKHNGMKMMMRLGQVNNNTILINMQLKRTDLLPYGECDQRITI